MESERMLRIIENVKIYQIMISGIIFGALHALQVAIEIPHMSFVENIFHVDYAVEQISAEPRTTIILFALFFFVWVVSLCLCKFGLGKVYEKLMAIFLVFPLVFDVFWSYWLVFGGDINLSGFVNVGLIKHIAFGLAGYLLAVTYLNIKS